ncbi:MAG: catalase/peroxidase HPI [Arcanobacterium sp.]|nr:catalase/peroxidase HPI [Arcanobacterium sp.]MDY5588906.1 catalase/peroxidase HPI [Arcanobacterium sp.]
MSEMKCPVPHGIASGGGASAMRPAGTGNKDWWPERLNLKILAKNPAVANPLGEDFDYKAAFEALDLEAVKADIAAVLTDSQDWWPADFGNYGPLFVRMAWHSAGTYRAADGRGGAGHGQQRFAPLNSWPDNVNLDRARRLLWPIKKKYGKALSWGDLMILAGTVAQEQMGLPVIGFAGGRTEQWEPDDDIYWGSETGWLDDDKRYADPSDRASLEKSLGATEMGLIYVDPEGPAKDHDPKHAALDIRETFARMGMDDEETVALIAGGHTFGKSHGMASGDEYAGPAPEAAPMEQRGLGWKSSYKSGKGVDAIGSGLEVTWTYHPTRWDNEFFHILFGYEWELMKSPAGAWQWRPKDGAGSDMVPEADGSGKREPRMLTTDLSLREDPIYREISLKFRDNQAAFTEAYARAWFKLTHRDMGPKSRWLGADVPAEDFLWADPIPQRDYEVIDDSDAAVLKTWISESELSVAQLVGIAWAAMSTFRASDYRGGANGGRIRLEPERSWEVNSRFGIDAVIAVLEQIQEKFNAAAEQSGSAKRVSFADVVVLAGNVGVEQAAQAAGIAVTVPFVPGRTDATQELTDQQNFAWLEPQADGFRNYQSVQAGARRAEYLLVDKANLLGLSAPQMAVLVGGMRAMGANWDSSDLGVLTDRPGVLTNDFFVNVLDMRYEWKPLDPGSHAFQAFVRSSGEAKWIATRADLVFASNSELAAIAEVYASDDAAEKFVHDFVAAWAQLAMNDRFDLA